MRAIYTAIQHVPGDKDKQGARALGNPRRHSAVRPVQPGRPPTYGNPTVAAPQPPTAVVCAHQSCPAAHHCLMLSGWLARYAATRCLLPCRSTAALCDGAWYIKLSKLPWGHSLTLQRLSYASAVRRYTQLRSHSTPTGTPNAHTCSSSCLPSSLSSPNPNSPPTSRAHQFTPGSSSSSSSSSSTPAS